MSISQKFISYKLISQSMFTNVNDVFFTYVLWLLWHQAPWDRKGKLHLTGVVRGALGEKLPQVCLVSSRVRYFLMQRGCSMMFNEGVQSLALWELRRLPSFSEVLRVFFPAIDHPANKCPNEFFLLNSKTCKSVQIHHDIGQGKVRKVPQRANLTISAFIGFMDRTNHQLESTLFDSSLFICFTPSSPQISGDNWLQGHILEAVALQEVQKYGLLMSSVSGNAKAARLRFASPIPTSTWMGPYLWNTAKKMSDWQVTESGSPQVN